MAYPEYIVKCPHCGSEAYLHIASKGEPDPKLGIYDVLIRTDYRCANCPWRPNFEAVPESERRKVLLRHSLAGVTMWKYEFASYYQTTIGTITLYFINLDQLRATIGYIADPLRDINKVSAQWRRECLRLPKEIGDGHHRERVLKKLRNLLAEGPD